MVGADCVEDSIADESWNELLDEQEQQNATDRGQVEVVDLEEGVKRKRCAVSHQLTSSKNYDIIRNQSNSRLFHGRHRCHTWCEDELLRLIAHDRLECVREDWP